MEPLRPPLSEPLQTESQFQTLQTIALQYVSTVPQFDSQKNSSYQANTQIFRSKLTSLDMTLIETETTEPAPCLPKIS